MKPAGYSLIIALVAVGCSPSKEIESEMKSKPSLTPAATTTTTTATTAGVTTASTGTTDTPGKAETTAGVSAGGTKTPANSTAKPTTPTTTDMASDNANRAFQLRSLQHSTLHVNGHSIDAWVMDTRAKRTEGMMFLTDKDVKDNQGMIFVFTGPQATKDGGFWMKNTFIPLDIIYIGADHKVLNVQAGKPRDEKSLAASGAYSDVLELKQGQAAKLGISHGTTIDIPKDLKATE